jgi:hypothetical protein
MERVEDCDSIRTRTTASPSIVNEAQRRAAAVRAIAVQRLFQS